MPNNSKMVELLNLSAGLLCLRIGDRQPSFFAPRRNDILKHSKVGGRDRLYRVSGVGHIVLFGDRVTRNKGDAPPLFHWASGRKQRLQYIFVSEVDHFVAATSALRRCVRTVQSS